MRIVALVLLTTAVACSSPRMTPVDLNGYRVEYRVEDRAPGRPVSVSGEIVEVRRPYDGRVETTNGARVLSGRVTSRKHFWQLGAGGKLRFGVLRQPGWPARDASLSALRDAARAGAAVEAGTDRVLGRVCTWFAYREPRPDPLAPPTNASRIESCVDGGGIVLREVWTLHGRAARVVSAVRLDRTAPPPSRFLEGRDPRTTRVTEPKGAEFLQTVTQSQDVRLDQARSPFTLDVPSGWRADRVSVVAAIPGQNAPPTQFRSQSFLRGEQLVVVESASASHLAPPWGISQGTRVRIGAGEARAVFYTDRVEIRLLSSMGFARVIAPSMRVALDFVRGLSAR